MDQSFEYDAFLSYNKNDRACIRRLAERLRDDGVRVWYDQWVVRPGDEILLKIEEGLERSRVMLLALSPSARGSDWVTLERNTVMFRDPSNESKRFIPLLIQDCEIPSTIKRFKYIDWRSESDEEYESLLDVVQPIVAARDLTFPSPPSIVERRLEGHTGTITRIAPASEAPEVLSASGDRTIKVWDLQSGKALGTLVGHTRRVQAIAATPDGTHVVSGSDDNTVKLWDLGSMACVFTFRGHESAVVALAVTADGRFAVSGTERSLKVWDLRSKKFVGDFEAEGFSCEYPSIIQSIGLTSDGREMLTASGSHLALWDLHTRKRVAVLDKRHDAYSPISSVAVSSEEAIALSVCGRILKLWDLSSIKCVATFEGHRAAISSISISPDGRFAASASEDNSIKVWNIENGACLQTMETGRSFGSIAFSADGTHLVASSEWTLYVYRPQSLNSPALAGRVKPEVRYTNAKVVLMGKEGVGKSALFYRLAEKRWKVTDSSHGMKWKPLRMPAVERIPDADREVWLWDLAGQSDYALIHQLFLDETSLALMLFNPQAEDPFEGIGKWENALRVAVAGDPVKLLVAARIDRGGAHLTNEKITQFYMERGFSAYASTSAKTGEGVDELLRLIMQHLPWDRVPWTSTTHLFKVLKDAVVRLKDEGIVLIRFSELRQRLQMTLPRDSFKEEDLRAVVGLLATQGLVKRLDFGDFVLLQPEQMNNYASAVIRAARKHVDSIGCINERHVLEGRFQFEDLKRLSEGDEDILLRAMVQTFLDQSLCIREDTPSGVQLVFPSQFKRDKDISGHPKISVSYRFAGPLVNIYTTLVVRLAYCDGFKKKALWKNAAEFLTASDKTVGLVMKKIEDGVGEMSMFFEADIPDDTRFVFIKYVHEHLLTRATDVELQPQYRCPRCDRLADNPDAVKFRLQAGKAWIRCLYCDDRIPLIDSLEQDFAKDRLLEKVHELDAQARNNLDLESNELVLVGQAQAVADEAGQIYKSYHDSRNGIDGEIEFKDDDGRPSGKKILLQLETESIHTRRQEETKTILIVNDKECVEQWLRQRFPVFLVIQMPDGVIRWMNVTEYWAKQSERGSGQFVFQGEAFTALSLVRLREKYL